MKTERKLLSALAKNVGASSFYTTIDGMLAKAKTVSEIAEILALNDKLVKSARYSEREHRHLTYRNRIPTKQET